MIEHHLDLQTPDGLMNTFITHPEEGGPHPVVLFYMDAPGKREELHDMARRLGSAGYYVILPNLYYRRAREFVVGGTDESRAEMFGHMDSLNPDTVRTDTQAMLDFAASDGAASGGKVGVVGYCMSGPFVVWAAAQFAERVAAAASLHGVRLCTDDPTSPHLRADQVNAELYFGCAEDDHWAPPEMVERLDQHLAQVNVKYRIEWYPGTQHGFVFPQRGALYHKPSAERHWERLHALFRRNL